MSGCGGQWRHQYLFDGVRAFNTQFEGMGQWWWWWWGGGGLTQFMGKWVGGWVVVVVGGGGIVVEAPGPVCWGGAFNTQFEGMAEWWGWGGVGWRL